MTGKRITLLVIVVAACVGVGVFFLQRAHHLRLISEALRIPIEGAVIKHDADAQDRLPIGGVAIMASDGTKIVTTESEPSGYFSLVFQKGVLSEKPITVTFRAPGYEPLDLTVQTGRLKTPKELYVAEMIPVAPPVVAKTSKPLSVVGNIRVRYTINSRTETNVASAAKTFQVVNKGGEPCDHQSPCSPDGMWKATVGSGFMDAGPDNSFGNIRASCIAGPCPFTRIDSSGMVPGKRTITVSALNWSDTTTFLIQAEVFHSGIDSNVRELYPVIFGQTLNFTVPPSQEGVSLEADLDGAPMVFPLGPDPRLSWANCTVRNGKEQEQTTVYRCELKAGFKFQGSSGGA
jgi:hypothetical protein